MYEYAVKFATLPNSLMSSSSFPVVCFGCPMCSLMSSADSESFYLFSLWIAFISVSVALLELAKLCWIKVVKGDIFVFFPILEGMLSVFRCWETGFDKLRMLWVCHVTLIMLCSLYALFLEGFFNHKSILTFIRNLFCNSRDDHMVFILQFVNVVYHIICGYWNTFASLG